MSPVRQRHLQLLTPAASPRAALAAPALDDSALLSGLKLRDPAVSAAFYERVRPDVDRTLTKLLGPRDSEYEDTAQVALYEIVSALHRFRGECPLDAWLSIVTARVAYRLIRRRRVERRIFCTTADEIRPESYFRPSTFAMRQALDRVGTHLAQMDYTRAWTFLLHDVHGYDLREISQITEVSLSAAQSRLVRGRREIHDRIRSDPALVRFLEDLSAEVP